MIQKGPKNKKYIYIERERERERESKSECSAGQKIINIKKYGGAFFFSFFFKDGPTFKSASQFILLHFR